MVIQGVIRPPPEIRAVADRTALYVAKNGRAFEKKILGSAKGRTPKFAFLQDSSPFHAYYEDRVQFYENGGEDEKEEDSKEKEAEEKKKQEEDEKKKTEELKRKEEATRKKASVVDPVAKALLTHRAKIAELRKVSAGNEEQNESEPSKPAAPIPPPPPLHFVNIVSPASLTLAQIETIQLVAQFTALDGKGGSFLSQLSLREWKNPAFGFCQPRHGHFPYFTALVDSYRRILDLWTADSAGDSVKEMAGNKSKCLDIAAYRAEYERDQEEQAMKRDEANDLAAQIDWHSFVVVETIDFPPDEVVEISMLPPPPPPAETKAIKEVEDDMEESDDEDGEQIRVVPSYKPKVFATNSGNKVDTVIDPITGKSIPVKDMPEHMRIQLLDPKWAEERKKFQDKQKESNLVSGDVVASNLQRFTQARGDMFGKKGHDILSGETDSKKRLEEANRIIREQGQQNSVGPSFPSVDPPAKKRQGFSLPAPRVGGEPESKRPRLDAMQAPSLPPPPQAAAPPPPPSRPEDAFAAAVTASTTTAPTSRGLMSAADFAAQLEIPEVTLQIRVPNDPSQMAWNFYGQIVSVSIDVNSKVKAVKEEISRAHLNSLPANKIQLKNTATKSFMKDSLTLAALNIGPTATLELSLRVRGGRK